MPLTVKVPGRSEPPVGAGIRESWAVGSLIPHSLTHSRTSLTGQAPPEGLSIPPGPLGPDLTWGLAAYADSEPGNRRSAPSKQGWKKTTPARGVLLVLMLPRQRWVRSV